MSAVSQAVPGTPCPKQATKLIAELQSVWRAGISNYLVTAIDVQLRDWCREKGWNVWYKDIKARSHPQACVAAAAALTLHPACRWTRPRKALGTTTPSPHLSSRSSLAFWRLAGMCFCQTWTS